MQQTFYIMSDSYCKLLLHHYVPVVEIQADGFHDNTMYSLLDDLTDLGQADKNIRTGIMYTKLRGTTFLF